MISKYYCRFDIRLFRECRKYTDKYRIEKIFRLLEKSIEADILYPERMNEHDDYFEPKNTEERNFWESCREYAKEDMKGLIKKHEGGKKGAEIRKQKKETPVVQPEQKQENPVPDAFAVPTEEEVLVYAKQMNDTAGMSGFKCTEQQALLFYAYFEKNEWKDKEGTPVKDWKKAFKYWVRRDEQYGYSKKRDTNTKEIEDFVALWQEKIYQEIKSVSPWEKVVEATVDNSKKHFQQAKEELIELVKNTKQRKEKKESSFLKVDVPYDNIWLFAMKMLVQRRFYSSFLYHECEITPAFFLKNIKILADPYCDEYMDPVNRWCHG